MTLKRADLLPTPQTLDKILPYLGTNFRRIVDAVALKILTGDFDPSVYGAAGYPQDIIATEADGSLLTLARADHVHKPSPLLVQVGSVNISVAASATGSAAVAFGTAFASTPKIIANLKGTGAPSGLAGYNITVFDALASGFTAFARHINDTVLTNTVPVDWIAILL